MAVRAIIRGGTKTLTVADLEPGTLFTVASKLSNRYFVRCGDGLSTKSYAANRVGGRKIKGSNSKQPPVFAVIVPTESRFDRRAFTPASSKINASTPVVATHGNLVLA